MAIHKIFNPKYETISREELETLQLRRLQDTVMRVYYRVPFYRRKMDELKVTPDDIKTLKDIRRLPVTTKGDLRDNYPFDLFAVPQREVIRIHASSGTTGKPIVVGYTRRDIETWSELVARIVTAAGVSDEDTAQIAFGYGLFTGGFGLHYGCEFPGDCPCGRTLVRMARVSGRNDDMLIIRGVNVFPSQIENVLMKIKGTEPQYQLIVDRKGALDTLEVRVEVSPDLFKDEMKEMNALQKHITSRIHSVLGIGVRVTLVEPKTIERSMGKAKRVIDKRNLT